MRIERRSTLTADTNLKVRDRQSSASLGLPSRIADEDCDIEDLYISDLQADDIAEVGHSFGAVKPEHIVYVTKMVEIARLRTTIPPHTSLVLFLLTLMGSWQNHEWPLCS